jgi:formylglycine-generating enzyme required for sulfatase activity
MYLDKSTFRRYQEELAQFSPNDFRIGTVEESSRKTIRICCGGNTDARLKGFAEIFGEDGYHVTEGYAASNSLIGYMDAQLIILFFEDRADYDKWLESGVELDFLQYNQPINASKLFVVQCRDRLPLDQIAELLGASQIFEELDISDVIESHGVFEEQNAYIDSMVMIPTGTAPYRTDPISVPQDARGRYFSGYITDTEGCDVEGAVFYNCQKYVDGALNYRVSKGDGYSNIKSPLLVGQSLITQALYESVMGTNPSRFRGTGDLPVEKVSWFDLLHFCNRLSELQGFRPCYFNIGSNRDESAEWDRFANGYRLLTEKEWEYIARANRAFEYSGSDDPNAIAWYDKNSGSKTHIVGTKQENSFGTYDQSGNLYEWCWDLSRSRAANRVLRGGNWYDSASYIRAASRANSSRSNRYGSYGGRLARSPDPLIP